MLAAFRLALADALDPQQRPALVLSTVLALALLLLLWLGATALIENARVAGIWWLDALIAALGSLGALALCWLAFPGLVVLVMGFFLEGVLRRVEKRRYPELPPPRRSGLAESLANTLRLLLLMLVLNVMALPFYLVPPINLFIYYGLNGYLVGREYFELVALRRVEGTAARAMWRWYRGRLVLAGVMIAILLSLPLINLVAPIVAAAFLLHVFEGLRRGAAG